MKNTNRILAFLLAAAMLMGFYVPATQVQAAEEPLETLVWNFDDETDLADWTYNKFWAKDTSAFRVAFSSGEASNSTATCYRATTWKDYSVLADVTVYPQGTEGYYSNASLITCVGGKQTLELRMETSVGENWLGITKVTTTATLYVKDTSSGSATMNKIASKTLDTEWGGSSGEPINHTLSIEMKDGVAKAVVDGNTITTYTLDTATYPDLKPGGLAIMGYKNGSATGTNQVTVDVNAVTATVYSVTPINGSWVSDPTVFTDDFEDETVGQSPDYWVEDNGVNKFTVAANPMGSGNVYKYSGTDDARTWLHVFETNVDYSAKVFVPAGTTTGKVGLITRMTGLNVPALVKAGYDFTNEQWFVENGKGAVEDYGEPNLAAFDGAMEAGKWHTIRVELKDRTLNLYCDDMSTPVLSAPVEQITTGRVGLFAEGVSAAYFDDVDLKLMSGQGRVEAAVTENYVLPDHPNATSLYSEGGVIIRYDENTLLFNTMNGFLFKSTDDGVTFTPIEHNSEEYKQYSFFSQSPRTQYVRLHNGYLLRLETVSSDVQTWLSKDNGATYEVVHKKLYNNKLDGVITSGTGYYGGMNEMLKEINLGDIDGDGQDNYRVFYCADVRTTGVEGNTGTNITYHWEEVYYTDDFGYTWQKADFDTRWYSGLDHICESRIIPVYNNDGSLKCVRMFCTWNDGRAVRYFDSYDYGKTWTSEKAFPELAGGRNSFAYNVDPETGFIYLAYLYGMPESDDTIYPRSRFVLLRSVDGEKWEFMMDIWRWDDVPDDSMNNVNQTVDPSLTIDGDYIYVTAGLSEVWVDGEPHNAQRQTVVRLDKNKLKPYAAFPEDYAAEDAICDVEVTAPQKRTYLQGQELDLTGGYITVHYYDGSTKQVSLSDASIAVTRPDASWLWTSEFDTEAYPLTGKAGMQWIRVEYTEPGRGFDDGFADGFYIYVGETEADVAAPVRNGLDAALEDKISINLHMGLSPVMAQDPGVYMKFIMGGKETIVHRKDAVIGPNNDFAFTIAVAAKEMTEVITAQLYNSVEGLVKEETFSVKDYLQYICDHKDQELYADAAPIAEALLNYGAAAQVHFKHNTGDLANGGFQAGWNSGIDVSKLAKYAPKASGTQPEGVQFYGSSVIMEDRTTIRHYFKMDADTAAKVQASLYGQALKLQSSGNFYYVDITGVDAANLDYTYTLELTDGKDTFAVTYSALSYVYQILSTESYSGTTMEQLAQALYLYNKSVDKEPVIGGDEFEILPI